MAEKRDYYEVLGIGKSATKDEIKKAAVKNTAVKTQKKVTSASAKTGVGAKKG